MLQPSKKFIICTLLFTHNYLPSSQIKSFSIVNHKKTKPTLMLFDTTFSTVEEKNKTIEKAKSLPFHFTSFTLLVLIFYYITYLP